MSEVSEFVKKHPFITFLMIDSIVTGVVRVAVIIFGKEK